jgi:DNA-binding protein HU-beta
MNKMELIDALATKTELSRKDAEKCLSALIDVVTEKLKTKEKVAITGFGTFGTTDRKARTGVNPQNPSQKIQIPAMTVPKFTAGKTLKDTLR